MKKLLILSLITWLGLSGFAQKKAGTIYSEHKYIDKTKEFWKAWVDNNKIDMMNLLADTIYNYNNGVRSLMSKEQVAAGLDYWAEFEDFKIEDMPPSTPDALEYDSGIIWVQDWLVVTGIHKPSGINLNLPLHMTYNFNKDGKITVLIWNYNNDVFEEINSSQTTSERGTIYDSHPYINTVRKMINAYAAMDVDKWKSYLAPNATFFNSTMKQGDVLSLETQVEGMKKLFEKREKISYTQLGPLNCMYYNEDGSYRVYSWWTMSIVQKDGKKIELPLMLIHIFNNDGKVVSMRSFYSSNHFE